MYEIGHLLTVPELAEALSVGKGTIYDWVHKKMIPYSKLGCRTAFSEDAIEELLKANRFDPDGLTSGGLPVRVELRKAEYKLGQLLTVSELAKALSRPERTVRDWVYRRTIPFTRLHRRVYFSTDVVEGLLEANSRPAGGRPGGGPESSDSQREGGASCEEDSNG